MRILTRYLIARFLAAFVGFLIVSSATIGIVEVMLNLGDMLRGDTGARGIASYLVLRLPAYYLRDLIPTVAFAAAFFTLGSSARSSELLAMKAGGLSPHRAAAPILGVAVALSASAFILNETLILEAARLWSQRDSKTNPVSFRRESFWYQRDSTIYNIGNADRDQSTLRGVKIYELADHGHLLRSIEAERATVSDRDLWTLESPLIRSFDPENAERAPISTQHHGKLELNLGKGSGLALMNADITNLSLPQLRQMIAQQRLRGRAPNRAQALLHVRLADPLIPFLFVLAAIPLGVRVEKNNNQSMTVSALYGIAIVAAFFSLRSMTDSLTAAGLLPPGPTPWLTAAALAGFGSWRYAKMPA